jgi:N-acetylneuraminic acid mutarotase/uncharacterized membrane protein YozB (DUF420 family)
MSGFWSSNLFADVTLVVQILFYLTLCAGVIVQLQGKYKWHDRLQIPVVVFNIFFILLVMAPTFRATLGGPLNGIPPIVTLIHASLGTIAQLLAIYCLLAGIKVLPRKIGVLRTWMWAAFTAWTATIIFGIGVYIAFYLMPTSAADVVAEHEADIIAEPVETVVEQTAPRTEEPITEHAAAPVSAEPEQTAGPAAPTEVVAEHDQTSLSPEPTAEITPSQTDEVVSEHVEEVTEVVEPEFSGQALQAQWQALQPTTPGPGPRYEHAMQYHPATNQLFVFGGRDGSQTFNDVWALDLNTLAWRQIAAGATVAPPARFSTVLSVDAAGENLYVATGHTQDGQNFNDIWKLNLAAESWSDLTAAAGPPPEARYGAPGGTLGGHLVTTHGFGGTRYDNTWRFNTASEQWENITPAGPVPLRRCLFAATPNGQNLVIHGGCASGFGDCFLDDAWILDTAANAWREVLSDIKPVGRQYHSLAVANANRVLLFGGQDASRAARDDVWLLDLPTGAWQPIETLAGPAARYQHTAVYVPNLGMLIFGGRDAGPLGDLWLLSRPTEAPATEPQPAATPAPDPISEHEGG